MPRPSKRKMDAARKAKQTIQIRTMVLLLVFVLAFFGFGVKAAIFPFHGWLPTASVAPTPVTALLHAEFAVSGIFGGDLIISAETVES